MKFIQTKIPDVILIEPDVYRDGRGFLMETWHKGKFEDEGINADFVQDNHSRSGQYILRGLHYQIQQPQGKLIRVASGEYFDVMEAHAATLDIWETCYLQVLSGKVFDVAVDLRRSSPNFGRWVGEFLSEENKKMLWIPPGFAHGFLVTSESADLCYKCSDFYATEHDRAIRWDDPDLGIDWPLPEGVEPILSDKDSEATLFREAEVYD